MYLSPGAVRRSRAKGMKPLFLRSCRGSSITVARSAVLVFLLACVRTADAQASSVDVQFQIASVDGYLSQSQFKAALPANLSQAMSSYSEDDEAVNVGDCAPGYYCPAGTMVSIACPAGTYQPLTDASNASACTPCPVGAYCPTQGTATPTTCPAVRRALRALRVSRASRALRAPTDTCVFSLWRWCSASRAARAPPRRSRRPCSARRAPTQAARASLRVRRALRGPSACPSAPPP